MAKRKKIKENAADYSLKCISYKGYGRVLIKNKDLSKELCKHLTSFVRISTCQRIEVYAEKDFPKVSEISYLSWPSSMQHLIEVLSGIDSGLFGELEIYFQIKDSLEKAREENHLSTELERLFVYAFNISEDIRNRFGLNESWINAILNVIADNKKVFIYGNGRLAKSLTETLAKKNLKLLNKQEQAEVIIVLKKDFVLLNNLKGVKIINFTEEEFKKDEIKMEELFTKPDNNVIRTIRNKIKDILKSNKNLNYKEINV